MTSDPNASVPNSPEQLLHKLLASMDAQTTSLVAVRAAYEQSPAVRASHGYLSVWFPQALENFAAQRARVARALDDSSYRRSEQFSGALRWYQSLGQGFDVDLSWSGRDSEVRVRNRDMRRTAFALDDVLARERTA